MGEWGTSTKEYRLVDFQQRVGGKIPTEENDEYNEPFSTNENTLKSRKKRERKKKEKQDYENLLREMREKAKKN